MVPVVTMPAVHEHVHQRAGQDQQPRQHPENMGRVLGEQEKAADREETEAHDPYRGTPERLFLMLVLHICQAPRAAQRAKKL